MSDEDRGHEMQAGEKEEEQRKRLSMRCLQSVTPAIRMRAQQKIQKRRLHQKKDRDREYEKKA